MRADRLLWLMLALQAEGRLTAEVLAARFEVSERTIYRDVQALAVAGVPVYTQTGTNGGIFLDEKYRTSLTGLSRSELQTLFLASDGGPLRDLGLTLAIQGTSAKLRAALPTSQQAEVQRLQQRFYIDSQRWFDYDPPPSILPEIQRAVWDDRKLALTYSNYEDQTSQRTIDAYALVAKAHVWYLVGRTTSGDYRSYRVARIAALTVTAVCFARDPDFDLVTYWKDASRRFTTGREATFPFYPALLRIAPQAFATLRSFIPERYEQVAEADEVGWLTIRVLFLSRYEAQIHALGLGAQVVVLEPAELAQSVLEAAQAIVAQPAFVSA